MRTAATTGPERVGHGPSESASARVAIAAQEHRGALMLEALVAACAVIAHADGRSSAIERWRLLTVVADDPLLKALPRNAVTEATAEHRRAFLADPAAARAAALQQVGRLAPEPHKARMVLDACILVTRADGRTDAAEAQALRDVKAALGL